MPTRHLTEASGDDQHCRELSISNSLLFMNRQRDWVLSHVNRVLIRLMDPPGLGRNPNPD